MILGPFTVNLATSVFSRVAKVAGIRTRPPCAAGEGVPRLRSGPAHSAARPRPVKKFSGSALSRTPSPAAQGGRGRGEKPSQDAVGFSLGNSFTGRTRRPGSVTPVKFATAVFFQRGFIRRGHPGVSSRGREAPREPVPDDSGTGRPVASPCRLSSTGYRPLSLGADEPPARRPRHRRAARGTGPLPARADVGRPPLIRVERARCSTDIPRRRSWRPRWEPLEPNEDASRLG